MKKFRKMISGFLAAALIITQTITPAYSEGLSDRISETSQTSENTAGYDETAAAPETGEPADTADSGDTGEQVSESQQTKDADYYEALRSSIEEKRRAAEEADVNGMGYCLILTEEESAYLQSIVEEDYAKAGQSTEATVTKDGHNSSYDTDYYYGQLSEAKKAIYDELYTTAQNFYNSPVTLTNGILPKVTVSSALNMSANDAVNLYKHFYYSNPQFFFLRCGWSITRNGSNVVVGISAVLTDRFWTASTVNTYKSNLATKTSQWLAEINMGSTALEKQELIYKKLCSNIVYTNRDDGDQDIAAAIVDGQCVCNGYALANEYLCNAVNIDCITVTSDTHAWNIVNLYGNWYEIDVTWMDQENPPHIWDIWLNKSHATFLANDQNNSHVYENGIWDKNGVAKGMLPSTTRDTVLTDAISSIAVTTAPTSTDIIYGGTLNFAGGVLTATKVSGATVEVDMAEAYTAGELTVTGFTATKIGSQTLTLKYGGKSTTLTVNVIVDPTDPPVTMTVDYDESTKTNYLDLQSALNAITAAGYYRIDIRHTQEYASVTIPSKANKVSIYTNSNVYLKTDEIIANADLGIEGNVAAKSESYKGPALTIASGKSVVVNSISNAGGDYTFRSITGTSSSAFLAYYCKVSVDGDISSLRILNTFGDDAYIATTGSISSVTDLGGFLLLAGLNKTASITNIDRNSTIGLAATVTNGVYKFAGLTVKNLPTDCSLSVVAMDETCSNRISVPAGTTLFKTTASGTYSKDKVTIPNTTSDGKALALVKDGTEVRAEIDGVVALAVDGAFVNIYPNLELAFANVKKDKANVIMLSTSVAPSSFTLPTSAQIGTGSLAIVGGAYCGDNGSWIVPPSAAWQDLLEANEDDVFTLTLPASVTTLSVPYDFELNNFTVNTSAALTIKPSKKLRLSGDTFGLSADITAASGSSADISIETCHMIRNITGTSASTLTIDSAFDCSNIKSFKKITANNNGCHLTGTMSDIAEFSGKLKLASTGAKATINTMTTGSAVFLIGELSNGALSLAQLTVTNVKGDSGTISINIENVNWESIPLPNGTVVMNAGDKNIDFTSKLEVTNYLSDGKTLGSAFKYGTDIKYEFADAVTLTVGDQEPRNFPNLEKAFESVQKDSVNTIHLNCDLAPASFALPTSAKIGTGTLVIDGKIQVDEDTADIVTITLPASVKTLEPTYNFKFSNIVVESSANLSISGSKNITITYTSFSAPTDITVTGTGSWVTLEGNCKNIRNIKGTSTALLDARRYTGYVISGDPINNITTFAAVQSAKNVPMNFTGAMTGVAEFSGGLILSALTSSAKIGTITNDSLIYLHSKNSQGTITVPSLTVTEITSGKNLELTLFDDYGAAIPLPNGTIVMKAGDSNVNFTPYVTITNKSSDNKTLHAEMNGTNIIADSGEGYHLAVYAPDADVENSAPIAESYYSTIEKALNAAQKDKKNILTLHANATLLASYLSKSLGTGSLQIISPYDENDALSPYTLDLNGAATLSTSYKLELANVKLRSVSASGVPAASITISAPEIVGYDIWTAEENASTPIKFSLTADNLIILGGLHFNIDEISASSAGMGWAIIQSDMTVKNIKNIGGIETQNSKFTVTGTVTGVTNICGNIILDTTANVTVSSLSGANILMKQGADGSLPRFTATYVDFYNNTPDSSVTVVDSTLKPVAVASGTVIFKMSCAESTFYSQDYTAHLKIGNKTNGAEGDALSAYLYGSDLKAEFGEAVTLTAGGERIGSYPNLDRAFKAVQKDKYNEIKLNVDVDAKTFTLPTAAMIGNGELKIWSVNKKLTLHNVTTLTPAYNFTLHSVELIPLNTSDSQVSTFTINGSKNVDFIGVTYDKNKTTINLSAGANSTLVISGIGYKVGTLTGTSTTKLELAGTIAVDKITTFGEVCVNGYATVNSSISGVDNLYYYYYTNELILPSTATASIKNLGYGDKSVNIVLLDDAADGLTLPKVTVTNINSAKFTVRDSTNNSTIAVPSGTKLFTYTCGETNFYQNNLGAKITIENKTNGTEGDALSAYLYGSDLKAEYGEALVLQVYGQENQCFPNFELAFKAVKKDKYNEIRLNANVNATKFVLPTSAQIGSGTLKITGGGNLKLILNNVTSLAPAYNFALDTVNLIPMNSKGDAQVPTFTIAGSMEVTLSSVKCDKTKTTINVSAGKNSNLEIDSPLVRFGTLTGTSTTTLVIVDETVADKVTTFGTVDLKDDLTVNTSVSGVDVLKCVGTYALILPATATATIKKLGDGEDNANVILLDNAADGLTLPKVTVTNIDKAEFTVKDSTNESVIAVPSGTKLFTYTCGETNFYQNNLGAKITITNNTNGDEGNALSAYLYGTELRAEYGEALALTVPGEDARYFPNFELAFKAVKKDKTNAIIIYDDIEAAKFVLPSAAQIGTGSLVIFGAHKLTLHNVITLTPAYEFTLEGVELIPLNTATSQVSTFTINGSKKVTLSDVTCDKTKTTVNVSAGKNSSLTLDSSGVRFGSVTGTSTTKLQVEKAAAADKVTTFHDVYLWADLTVNSSMSGVGELYSNDQKNLILPSTATATITTLGAAGFGVNVVLLDNAADGLTLPKVTVTNIIAAKFIVKDSTNANVIALPSGTAIFKVTGTEADFNANQKPNFTIENKTAADKTLDAFYYNREIRAEVATALTLTIDNGQPVNYPNFEKAFAAVQKDKSNTIILNENIEAKTFVLPTDLGKEGALYIGSSGERHSIILKNVTAISPKYDFTLSNVELIPKNSKGDAQVPTFTITGSKKVDLYRVTCADATTINVTVGTGNNLTLGNNDVKFGTLTGRKTSELTVCDSAEEANTVKTFKAVTAASLFTVNTSVSDVDTINCNGIGGSAFVIAPTATATVKSFGQDNEYGGMGANIVLLAQTDADGNITKLPNVTVTNIYGIPTHDTGTKITVKTTADGDAIAVPSGTAIFKMTGTEADFNANQKPNFTIVNKTADNKTLEAFYYNKEIRAEVATSLTLTVNDENGNKVFEANYPNFEKAFPAVQKDKRNIITLNDSINADKFVLPAAAQIGTGSLEINGKNGLKNLTLHNISSLSASYKLTLTNIVLVPMNSKNDAQVTAFSITGTKGVTLNGFRCDNTKTTINVTVGSGSVLELLGCAAKFGTLTGTSTSTLRINGSHAADKVSTFGLVEVVDRSFEFTVNNSMTGVTKLTTPDPEDDGYGLTLAPTATAAITEAEHAVIMLLAETDANGNITKLPKLTLTKVTADNPSQITVEATTDGDAIAVPSGTTVLYAGSNTDIAANITFGNKDANGNDLMAVTYGKEIRAEIPGVLRLSMNGELVESFTSFEKLFAKITDLAKNDRTNQNVYEVTLNSDIDTKVFTLPTYGAGITFKSAESHKYKLTLRGVNISYKNYPVNFVDVDVTVVKS